ncbi:MAG: chromophore lyase CpcT/CpeT [Phycisphaerae bacterium]|nr:chromophore lyase CpcT/CpeT [Phycisphaerae bacterium]
MLRLLSTITIAVAAALAGCKTAPTGGVATDAEPGSPEHLAAMMAGSYSSKAQSEADPEFRDIRLSMVRIWPTRPDGPWLYVEQAAATSLDKPYRQRVYQVLKSILPPDPAWTVESRVYELPGDPLAFAGAWTAPARFDAISPESLLPRDGCTVFLSLREDGSYAGGTYEQECASSLRGAAYATSEVVITAEELRSWDRGFDKDGKQVWGAVKGPYQFLRITPEDAKAAQAGAATTSAATQRPGTTVVAPAPATKNEDRAPPMR